MRKDGNEPLVTVLGKFDQDCFNAHEDASFLNLLAQSLVSLTTHDVTLNGCPWRRLSLSAMQCKENIDLLRGHATRPFNGNLNHQFAGLGLD
jgi:hypothetical protein